MVGLVDSGQLQVNDRRDNRKQEAQDRLAVVLLLPASLFLLILFLRGLKEMVSWSENGQLMAPETLCYSAFPLGAGRERNRSLDHLRRMRAGSSRIAPSSGDFASTITPRQWQFH